jgi:1-acyl-sn-glycerol-3-phosphate acyltransferase
MDATLLTRLRIPWLWGADVERAWVFMYTHVKPITAHLMAPGSCAYGRDRIPASGGGVLAANHLSALDPPLVGSFSRRAIWYMMKAELLEIPVVGEALTWTGAFPIRRGQGDRDGIRKARELVREGHIVGVFVEGTRQRLGYPTRDIHAGAVAIAMNENVPVIPTGVESFGWSRKNRRACCVVYGAPMTFEGIPRNGRGYREATELLADEIYRLWRQAAEAIAAGRPPELPDGTPRTGIPGFRTFIPAGTPRRVSGLA